MLCVLITWLFGHCTITPVSTEKVLYGRSFSMIFKGVRGMSVHCQKNHGWLISHLSFRTKELFTTWYTVSGRQRINPNVFLRPYDLFYWKKNTVSESTRQTWLQKLTLFRRSLTLFTGILLHHVWLGWSSLSLPILSRPLLSTDCLSFPTPEGLGPPSPPSHRNIFNIFHFIIHFLKCTNP